MSEDNNDLKPIQYYELLDIKNILELYFKEAKTQKLRLCYKEVIANIDEILKTF